MIPDRDIFHGMAHHNIERGFLDGLDHAFVYDKGPCGTLKKTPDGN